MPSDKPCAGTYSASVLLGQDGPRQQWVPVLTPSDALLRLQLPQRGKSDPISLIKVDVEGAELGILEGLAPLFQQLLIEHLVVEITPRWWYLYENHTVHQAAALLHRLAACGYRVSSLALAEMHERAPALQPSRFLDTTTAEPMTRYLQAMASASKGAAQRGGIFNLFQEDLHFERTPLPHELPSWPMAERLLELPLASGPAWTRHTVHTDIDGT